jgi:NADH-quinone oxidoreductase subunit L
MFLGAGSVMHGMDDRGRHAPLRRAAPCDADHVPHVRARLPRDHRLPGLSGFWSKDKIIEAAFEENLLVGSAALLGAGITAFYMTRLMLMTFFGERRWAQTAHPHESPAVMTVPLMVLAAGSVVGGILLLGDWINEWLEPVVGHTEHHELPVSALVITGAVTLTVVAGAALAWMMYGQRSVAPVAPRGSALTVQRAPTSTATL